MKTLTTKANVTYVDGLKLVSLEAEVTTFIEHGKPHIKIAGWWGGWGKQALSCFIDRPHNEWLLYGGNDVTCHNMLEIVAEAVALLEGEEVYNYSAHDKEPCVEGGFQC